MRLSDPGRTCDLGSPVRETCTPGSEWGDGYKESCRLGEATASKGAAPARLRKGYRSEACPYQPHDSALRVDDERGPPRQRWQDAAAHQAVAEGAGRGDRRARTSPGERREEGHAGNTAGR